MSSTQIIIIFTLTLIFMNYLNVNLSIFCITQKKWFDVIVPINVGKLLLFFHT
jgi:hypothetical protein